MSLIKRLTESFGKGKLKKEQREELWRIMQIAVTDGRITDNELNKINSFYLQSDLNEKEFAHLKDAMYWQVVQTLIADRRITKQEETVLQHIANILEISSNIYQLAQKEISYFALLESVSNGILPNIQPNEVILQRNETAHLEMPAYLMEERVVSRKIIGKSQGFSFRIVKGVTYRVGSSSGTIQSETGWVNVSSGNFVITNKRLIFAGSNKSFSFDLGKLLDIQLYSDGIRISVTNRQKPVIVGMYSDKAGELCGTILSAIINS